MRKTLALAITLASGLVAAAPAAAQDMAVTLPNVVPGVSTLNRLDFKVDERQYAFDRKCAPFTFQGVRYTGVRSNSTPCAQVKRFVTVRTPSAFVCHYFPLALTFQQVLDGLTLYRADVARVYCNRSPDGKSFAVTARA